MVESFFDLCRHLPFTLFAIIMEQRKSVPNASETYLPNQFRYLLQRVDQIAQESGRMATLLFDGDGPTLYGGTLPSKFEAFLYRSNEGRSFTNISDAPYFVDSRLTQGIQIADMAAYVCRIYHESNLSQGLPQGDSYLSAINRYYGILRTETVDLISTEGHPRPGIYFMPERNHYRGQTEQGRLESLE